MNRESIIIRNFINSNPSTVKYIAGLLRIDELFRTRILNLSPVSMYLCIYLCMYIYEYMNICKYCMYACMYVHVYVSTYNCQ